MRHGVRAAKLREGKQECKSGRRGMYKAWSSEAQGMQEGYARVYGWPVRSGGNPEGLREGAQRRID